MNIKDNIKIERLDDLGRGIGYIDEKIIFIENTLPSEIVDVEIINDFKKYYEGKVISFKKISNERIEPNCPYYKKCGGCSLLHVNYEYQKNYKIIKLENILKKFGNIDKTVEFIENKNIFNYRNKIDLKINNNKWGYYNNKTHNFVSIDKCLLASSSINEVITHKELFNINNGNIIIRSNYNDEIIIVINSDEEVNIDVNELKKFIKLVGIIVNDKLYYGEKYFIECINNKLFKVNYNSFFQVNPYITKKMINIIDENIYGNILLDLYCGVGFLGQCVSNKLNKIYGIEINENSILDAISNANMNRINNTYYMCGNSSKIIEKIKDNIDTVIIDPPRTGLFKNMVEDIKRIGAKRLIYISCNPISLARDLKKLNEYYNLEKIYALDMFSNTYHIESISILNMK